MALRQASQWKTETVCGLKRDKVTPLCAMVPEIGADLVPWTQFGISVNLSQFKNQDRGKPVSSEASMVRIGLACRMFKKPIRVF
jgi:hypothetical protein